MKLRTDMSHEATKITKMGKERFNAEKSNPYPQPFPHALASLAVEKGGLIASADETTYSTVMGKVYIASPDGLPSQNAITTST